MHPPVIQTPASQWTPDSPLAMEGCLTVLEAEQAYQRTVDDVLAHLWQRLGRPMGKPPALSATQVRALFARYQRVAPPPQLLSQMVADMREE